MPIYAYHCRACGHQFDRLQKLSEPDPGECPVCGAAEVQRQLTAPTFRLAGSGWYETDFKKDSDKKRNLADAVEPAKKESAKENAGASATTDKPAVTSAAEKPAAEKPAKPSPDKSAG